MDPLLDGVRGEPFHPPRTHGVMVVNSAVKRARPGYGRQVVQGLKGAPRGLRREHTYVCVCAPDIWQMLNLPGSVGARL